MSVTAENHRTNFDGDRTKAASAAQPNKRKRVAFFPHEGLGMGHVSRIAKIASAMAPTTDCLIITGQREVAWLTNSLCDFVKLPSLNGISRRRADFLGTTFQFCVDADDGIKLRKEIIDQTVGCFAPDAVVVDHIPAGLNGELYSMLKNLRAKKYLTFRAVQGSPTESRAHILANGGEELLKSHYDRIFVAADKKTSTFHEDFQGDEFILERAEIVGYAPGHVSHAKIAETRTQRGLGDADYWIVCSAGAGIYAGQLWETVVQLARTYETAYFDIVLGPRSRGIQCTGDFMGKRVRLIEQSFDLGLYHAAADLVITHGGSNSILEAMSGGARLIVMAGDSKVSGHDERKRHAELLSAFYPLQVAADGQALARAFSRINLNTPEDKETLRVSHDLDMTGAEVIDEILEHDFREDVSSQGR